MVSEKCESLDQDAARAVGVRVVYLLAGEDLPVFLLTVFAKNEKANLGNRERTVLISAAKQMVEDYRKRK